MALFETVNVSNLLHAWIPILYAGILSSGVGYTLQIIGQKGLNPATASLLMSLESVFPFSPVGFSFIRHSPVASSPAVF